MPRLTWGSIGERFFEIGIDRGVLYPKVGPGVPWNGLVSVQEKSSGGSPKPYYYDGYKYLNTIAMEEFMATIEAFSSPVEFDRCDGVFSINNGLFATSQPREQFGFAYRTRVGNDVDGTDLGYKIHLIYDALASPSGNNRSSISSGNAPSTISWDVTTSAPFVNGFKPTAHLVIDSRYTPELLLVALEQILYGDDIHDPSLPSPDEISNFMATHEGSFLPYRTNLATYPVGINSAASANTLGIFNGRDYGTGGAGSYSLVTEVFDTPAPEINQYLRKTWSGTPSSNADSGFSLSLGNATSGTSTAGFAVSQGTTYTFTMWLRPSSTGKTGGFKGVWRNSAGSIISTFTESEVLNENVWNKIIKTVESPVGATSIGLSGDISGGTLWAIGDTLDGTGLIFEVSSVIDDYFMGSTAPIPYERRFEWAGSALASKSTMYLSTYILPPTTLHITDLGFGEYSAFGNAITLIDENLFSIDDPSVVDNGNETFTIHY